MTIHTYITIKATPEKVWNVLLDFQKYREWNPFITAISGTAQKGARLKVQISDMVFRPRVLVYESSKELRWLGKLWPKGIFDGEHAFRIQQTSQHEVRFEQKEHFSGILVSFFRKKLQTDTKKGFEAMNTALKNRCES